MFTQLAIPAFTQIFVDNVLINRIYGWNQWFLFAIGVVTLLLIIFKFLQNRILSRLYIHFSTRFFSKFLWHILRLPYFFYVQRSSGETANRMNLIEDISSTLIDRITPMVIDATTAVFFAAAMFYYDPIIAEMGIVLLCLDFFLLRYLYESRENAYAYYQQTIGKSMSYSIDTLKGIETIERLGIRIYFFGRWAGFYTKTINTLQDIEKRTSSAACCLTFSNI